MMSGAWPGFSNAYLLTGDTKYIDVLRKQLDILYEHKKVEDGRTLLPQMYGDPRGYKYKGKPEHYHYTPNLFTDRLTEIYLWSMDRTDLERVPTGKGWIGFLEGNDSGYPARALRADLEHVRRRIEAMRNDPTTADTRLADWLLGIVPPATNALTQLTLGGYFASGRIWVLHSRLRYFDPVRRRSGLPTDVAALVDRLTSDSASVTLVNTNQVEAREVLVQAGGYGEHRFQSVDTGDGRRNVDTGVIHVRLEPGAGQRITFGMDRYAQAPTLAQPWSAAIGPAREKDSP